MKRVKVNLFGNVTYHAYRDFVLEVPDDVNIASLDQQVLESMADDARIAWEFDAEGYVEVTDHVVEELGSEPSDLPVVPLAGNPS